MFQHARRMLAAGAAALGLLAGAGAAQGAPALWMVKSPTATLYLFGTMHLLERDAHWRTPTFDAAYASAGALWFETDVSSAQDPKLAQGLILRYGLDTEHPLSSKLDAEHLSALKALLEHDRLPFAGIERLRPWAAALIVMAAPMMKAGFDPKAGADVQLTASALADHKPVRTFETLDQQMHFFADLPPAAEVQMLDDTVDDNAKSGDQVKAMETAWIAGDLPTLGSLLLGDMKSRYPDLYEVLIRRRNQAWSEALAKELAGQGTELVNVGALHMVGDDGLPALLKAKGFTVERVQ